MLENEISSKFIRFLKKARKNSKVSVRELAKAVNKSPSYISELENGRIRTIAHKTAVELLEYINIKGNIFNTSEEIQKFLSDNFNIHPISYWKEVEAIEATERAEKEAEYDSKIDKLNSYLTTFVDADHQQLLDFILSLVTIFPHSYASIIEPELVLTIVKIILDQEVEVDFGQEIPIVTDLKEIIKKHNNKKG